MFVKAEMATDIVSQLCFDPATIAWWIGAVRARGVSLPIWIGLPGCVDHAKLRPDLDEDRHGRVGALPEPSARLGVAPPHEAVQADRLLDGLAQVVEEPDTGVAGFHLYTFNEVGRTERWRQRAIARLETRRAT